MSVYSHKLIPKIFRAQNKHIQSITKMVEHLKKEALNRYGSELQVNWEKTQEI